MEAKIEAFEMWSYRRIMRISWKEMKSNVEVLKIIGLKNMELVLSIKKKKLAYYGHVRRRHSLQKLVLEGKVDGERGRGQRRKSWTGNLSEMTKMSLAQCSVKALDRSEWRTMVSNLYADGNPIDCLPSDLTHKLPSLQCSIALYSYTFYDLLRFTIPLEVILYDL